MEDKVLKDKIQNLDDQDVNMPDQTKVKDAAQEDKLEDDPEEAAVIELDDADEKDVINSYVQLAKVLGSEQVTDINEVVDILNKTSFVEDDEIMYANRPASVYYKQLPVVANDYIKVKIVLLTQAESLALIIPEKVSEVYEAIKEDPSVIIEKNKSLSLYAEIYRFNANDAKLQDIIKSVYLSAGDSLRAFDIPKEMEQEAVPPGEDGEDQDVDASDNFDNMFGSTDDFAGAADDTFETMDDSLEEFAEFEENAKSYNEFKKQSDVLENLSQLLYNKVDKDIREFIKVKFVGESKSLMVLEVDNKSIFDRYHKVPKVAKRIMTAIGESLRKDSFTQLVDSFIKEGKRYFIVAEDIGSNFWITEDDDIRELVDYDDKTVLPIQEDIIILKRSSVRLESRTRKPYLLEDHIVFN